MKHISEILNELLKRIENERTKLRSGVEISKRTDK